MDLTEFNILTDDGLGRNGEGVNAHRDDGACSEAELGRARWDGGSSLPELSLSCVTPAVVCPYAPH